jgi:hypothetical protein
MSADVEGHPGASVPPACQYKGTRFLDDYHFQECQPRTHQAAPYESICRVLRRDNSHRKGPKRTNEPRRRCPQKQEKWIFSQHRLKKKRSRMQRLPRSHRWLWGAQAAMPRGSGADEGGWGRGPSGSQRRCSDLVKGPWCRLEGGWIGVTTKLNFFSPNTWADSAPPVRPVVMTGQTGQALVFTGDTGQTGAPHRSDRCSTENLQK